MKSLGDHQAWRHCRAATVLLACGLAFVAEAHGQVGKDFYAGKSLEMIVGFSAGGGYDAPARLLARHYENNLPGKPKIVVRNMPGGGSRTAAGYVYNVAPKDGTIIATFDQSLPLQQALGEKNLNFDAPKFTWVGNIAAGTNILMVWAASGVKTIEDAKHTEVSIGATGSGSSQQPKIMNVLLGTKFKIILGYPGGNEINLALERGEVHGRTNTWASIKAARPDWIKDGKINILAQIGLTRAADLPNVPLLMDLASNEDDRNMLKLLSAPATIGRPIVSTPGLPEPVKEILRTAFNSTMKDPAFLEEAEKQKMEVNPMTGEELERIIADINAVPKPVAEKLGSLLGSVGEAR